MPHYNKENQHLHNCRFIKRQSESLVDEGTRWATAGCCTGHGRRAYIYSITIGVVEEGGVSPWITGLQCLWIYDPTCDHVRYCAFITRTPKIIVYTISIYLKHIQKNKCATNFLRFWKEFLGLISIRTETNKGDIPFPVTTWTVAFFSIGLGTL